MLKSSLPLVLSLVAAIPAHAGPEALAQLLDAAGAAALSPVPVPPASQMASPTVSPDSAPAPALPDEFTISERAISLTDTFDIKSDGASLGTITAKLISLTKSFTYEDAKGVCVAKAHARLLSWGTHIDVTDCSGQAIGGIKENVFKSLFKVQTSYAMLDAKGKELATSKKVDWISTDVTIRRPDGGAIAALHRRAINIISDKWTVKISDHAAVDSRLIVMIAAYKSSVDNDRRE